MKLENKVKELEQVINDMSEKIEYLQGMVFMLKVCKLGDPRLPYTNWLVYHDISEKRRFLAELVMSVLAERLEGGDIDPFLIKDIPGISSEMLYKKDMPHYEDAEKMLMTVLELKHKGHIPVLLKKMYAEGKLQDLCEHLLSEIGMDVFED